MSRVLIVGGGASGMVCAIKASSNNEVILIDKNNNLGKKILVTGNGKCNYWNKDINIKHYNSTDIDVLDNIITDENKKNVLDFFDDLGIIPKIKDGYYYPISNQATSIQTALILECKLRGVEIKTEEEVKDIAKIDNGFLVTTNVGKIKVDKVVLATGSRASIKNGNNSMYEIAKNLGHTIVPVLPALVQLELDATFLKDWHGIRQDALVSLYQNNNLIKSEFGELQLTDYGVSGICVFQLSSLVSRGLYQNIDNQIEINFLHNLGIKNEMEFIDYFEKRNDMLKGRNISELLDGVLNYKLINLILKISKVDRLSFFDDISYDRLITLGKNFTKLRLRVKATKGYENAQVCTGGVKLNEINPENMESLIVKDLYIVGELIDVDGECGGFNLGFAFISGYLAGRGISND